MQINAKVSDFIFKKGVMVKNVIDIDFSVSIIDKFISDVN